MSNIINLDDVQMYSELGAFLKKGKAPAFTGSLSSRSITGPNLSYSETKRFNLGSQAIADINVHTSLDNKWYSNQSYWERYINNSTYQEWAWITTSMDGNQLVVKVGAARLMKNLSSNASFPGFNFTVNATLFEVPYKST